MSRPESITQTDIEKWNLIISEDPLLSSLPEDFITHPLVKEVMYAGLWLSDRLIELSCPEDIQVRMQYHAGKVSFGRDPWEVHQELLQAYKDNTLIFEPDPNELLN